MPTAIVHVDGKKRCTQCHQWLPATTEYFNRRKRSTDGLSSECKVCHRADDNQYYADNRDERLAVNRQYSIDNAEAEKARKQRWQEENREQQRAANRAWGKKYPEKQAAKKRNRDARLRAAEGTHTAADIEAQYQRQHGKCYYCNCKLTKTPHKSHSATVDHVVPLIRGGSNDPSNLVIACAVCNFSKKDKLPHEWARGGKLL